ncbi:MAG: aspartate/glutamate racemase family protein [Acidobacteriota bacterium]
MTTAAAPATLGLVGGLGVPATMHYYRHLVRALEQGGREAHIVISHAKMQRGLDYLLTGDLDALAAYLVSFIRAMAAAGATVAAIPAVTPHICAAQLADVSPIPFVNILDVIAAEVRRRGLARVALLGTRYTIESALFGQLSDVETILPKPDEIDRIHTTYLQIANGQGDANQHRGLLGAIAAELCRRESLDAILLAGTDLSLIFNAANTDFPNLDCAAVHLAAIERALYPGVQCP